MMKAYQWETQVNRWVGESVPLDRAVEEFRNGLPVF